MVWHPPNFEGAYKELKKAGQLCGSVTPHKKAMGAGLKHSIDQFCMMWSFEPWTISRVSWACNFLPRAPVIGSSGADQCFQKSVRRADASPYIRAENGIKTTKVRPGWGWGLSPPSWSIRPAVTIPWKSCWRGNTTANAPRTVKQCTSVVLTCRRPPQKTLSRDLHYAVC